MREPGYYYVKYTEGGFEIAEFIYIPELDKPFWNRIGCTMPFQDDEFEEIDERRIIRDEPCKSNQFKGAKLNVWDKDWNLIGTINCDPAE
jgi:hypothetical protein